MFYGFWGESSFWVSEEASNLSLERGFQTRFRNMVAFEVRVHFGFQKRLLFCG